MNKGGGDRNSRRNQMGGASLRLVALVCLVACLPAVRAQLSLSGSMASVCGNFICESGEDVYNCPGDCGGSGSGSGESTTPMAGYCGDGICGEGETMYSCESDCPGGSGSGTGSMTGSGSYVPAPWCSGKCQCETFTTRSGVLTDGSPFGSGPKGRLEWLEDVYDAGSTCNWIIAPTVMPEPGMPVPAPKPVQLTFAEFWLDHSDWVDIYSCRHVEGCTTTNYTNAMYVTTFYGTMDTTNLTAVAHTGIMLVRFISSPYSRRFPGFKAVWKAGADAEDKCFDSDQCAPHEMCSHGTCVNNLCGEGLACDECRAGHNPCKAHEVCVDPNMTMLGDAQCECSPDCDGVCDENNFCDFSEIDLCHGPMGNPCTEPGFPICREEPMYPMMDPRRALHTGKPTRRAKHTRRDHDEVPMTFVCLPADRCEAPSACPAGYLCQDPCVVDADQLEMTLGSLAQCTHEVSVTCGGVDECVKYAGICGDKECHDSDFSVETGNPADLCEYDECDNVMNLCYDSYARWGIAPNNNPFKMNRPETVGSCVDHNKFNISGGMDMYNEIECTENPCYDIRGNPKCGMNACREAPISPYWPWYNPVNYECRVDECESAGCGKGRSCRDPNWWTSGDFQCGVDECEMEGACMMNGVPMAGMCHDPNYMVVGDVQCGVELDECMEGMYMCGPGEMCVENNTFVKDDWHCVCTCDHGCDMDGKCLKADECSEEMRSMSCPDMKYHCRDDDHTKFGGVQCGVDECVMADKFCYNCDGKMCYPQLNTWAPGFRMPSQTTWDKKVGAVSCHDPNFMVEGDAQCGAAKADLCKQVPYTQASGDERTVEDICMDYLHGMGDRYDKSGYPEIHQAGGCHDDDLIGFTGVLSDDIPEAHFPVYAGGAAPTVRPYLTWENFRQVCGLDECQIPGICGGRRCKDVNRLKMDGPEVVCAKDDCEEGPCLPEEMCSDIKPFKHAEKDFKSGGYAKISGGMVFATDRANHQIQLSKKIYDDGVMCAIDECETSCRKTEDCRDPNHYVKGDVMCGLDECTRNPCGPKETCMDYNFMRFGDFVCQFDECKQAGEPLCKWYETCRDTDLQNYGGVQCGVDECAHSRKYGNFSKRFTVGVADAQYYPSASDDSLSDFGSCMPQDKCFDPDFSAQGDGICDDGPNGKMACRPTTQSWSELTTAENPHHSPPDQWLTPFHVLAGKTSRCIPSKIDVMHMSPAVRNQATDYHAPGYYTYSHCVDYKSCNEGWADECVGDPCNSFSHMYGSALRNSFHFATSPANSGWQPPIDPSEDGLHGPPEWHYPNMPTWSGPFSSLSASGSGPAMGSGSGSNSMGGGTTTSPMPASSTSMSNSGPATTPGGTTSFVPSSTSMSGTTPPPERRNAMAVCGNSACEEGEDPIKCPSDCSYRREGDRHFITHATAAKHEKVMQHVASKRRSTSGMSHQDSDLFTQWSCRDRDWTKMSKNPLDICGIDECQQRPYPCEHSFENCIDRDITRAGTVTCWVDECRINNPCHKDQACFDSDIFNLQTPLECKDTMVRPWGKRPEYANCELGSWQSITEQLVAGTLKFETSSLGKLRTPDVNTWVCVEGHVCASTPIAPVDSSHFCFVYHESAQQFVSWGTAAETKLLFNSSSCSSATVF